MENLGISPSDRALLVSELEVIINCAASVNFDDHLHDAIRINYQGTLKMLDLGHQCQKLVAWTHVSTAYVNSNREQFIEEKIYELANKVDSEEVVQNLLKLDP
jgi:nucleoside-diphosphate-sugar epimerase